MKIVVLDGFTLNPGDLSWEQVAECGDCTFFDRSEPVEVIERLQDAAAALTNKVPIDRATISALPKLKYIGVTATGYNIIDTAAANEHGITVTNVPAYSTDSVAQATFALLLELANRVGHHAQTVRDGRWSRCPDFCYWDFSLIELAGLNLGIIGYGRIGQQVARIGLAFGMNILATPSRAQQPIPGVQTVSLETLLVESDVVSLHCPLTPQTKGLINAQRLCTMKKTAFLLNTSRGPLIVEADLADALNQHRIAGAGLDVLSEEPPAGGSPLISAPNCFITPHQAWGTRAARQRLMNVTAENLRAWLNRTPQNVVS
jgi:glycerate dehydrogenase